MRAAENIFLLEVGNINFKRLMHFILAFKVIWLNGYGGPIFSLACSEGSLTGPRQHQRHQVTVAGTEGNVTHESFNVLLF